MMEVGAVIAKDGSVIHWHLPPNRSAGALPDSRDLWTVLWENRDILAGVAHTHPWEGEAWPSHEDLTTFDAVEKAFGRELDWWVVTFNQVARIRRDHATHERAGWGHTVLIQPGDMATNLVGARFETLPWVGRLRELSK